TSVSFSLVPPGWGKTSTAESSNESQAPYSESRAECGPGMDPERMCVGAGTEAAGIFHLRQPRSRSARPAADRQDAAGAGRQFQRAFAQEIALRAAGGPERDRGDCG